MNPLFYALIGLVSGAGITALIFAIARRGRENGSELINRFELLERAQERGERLIREEMARSREENANAAKTQRGELTASLESVRGIVDLRLKQLQDRSSQTTSMMSGTISAGSPRRLAFCRGLRN